MPPKKQQQDHSNPYVPFYVLPIFLSKNQTSEAQKILRKKQINIKKCIDQTKIIQLLKQKGLAQHIKGQSQIGIQGKKFICENIKIVLQDLISEVTKPVDPKKDTGKKDSKKDSKKQEVPTETNKQPIIELHLQKKCNDFFIFLDFPVNIEQLRKSVQNGLKIDALVIIEEKIKKGSNLPNYDLLGRSFEPNQLMETLNLTKIQEGRKGFVSQDSQTILRQKKKMIKQVKKIKNENQSFSDLVIVSIPFQKDVSHPQNDELNFINSFFSKLCEISREKENYENWVKNSTNKNPMIQPLKEIVTKQVAVESQDKKGKKDANKQVEYTTVEQVIETKYESIPQNIKSTLQEYKQLQSAHKNSSKNNKQIKTILQDCLQGIELQTGKIKNSFLLQVNPQKALEQFKSKSLVKTTFIQSLSKNLRQVQSFSKEDLSYNLIHSSVQINKGVSLSQIQHQDRERKESLQFQFIIKAFTDFMNDQQPRIRMDFSDRFYREKLNKNQVLSAIQHELLKDPKIYEGDLKNDHIKLLCMARINPPGRVLYLNNIFQPKAVPNFQNWFKSFRSKLSNQDQYQFYDYKFQDIGNLSIRKQISTPSDNVTICDQKITIGSQQNKVIHLSKLDTTYGIRKLYSQKNEFWLNNSKQNINISIFKNQHQFKKIVKITQNIQVQGSDQIQTVQKQTETIESHQRVQLWIRTQNFIVSQTPYPTIYWLNSNKNRLNQQIRRQFGPKGQITSYLSDGSVKIFYLNGNVSNFRNNKWEKIINNELITLNTENKKLQIKVFTQGDKVIKIRQDQTFFVQFSNGNKLTVFNDGTKILYKKNQNIYQVQNNHPYLNQEIIVKIAMPRFKDFNIIGHGSAFSYLGFKDILQRSYDGFLYQIWHNKFSTHLYNEKYEFQNKLHQEEIRLVHFSDGSLLKIQGQQHVIFIQGDYEHSQEKLRHKWDQAFTIQQNHEQGVYNIHLNKGTIITKDSQSNQFKINVEQQNEIKIAVSFKINDEDQVSNEFGNGFHVPQQNFFLPAPGNSLPPRIFSFNNNTNQYYEYLSEDQIRQMSLSSSLYREEETVVGHKTIKQFTRQIKHKNKFDESIKITSFSHPPSTKDFQLPSGLLPKETRINLNVQNHEIQFRILQKIDWDKGFNNIQAIEQKIKNKKELRQNQMKNFSIST